MHAAQGFGYAFPDLGDPLFLVRSVVEEEGRPRMAAFLRLTAEAYLLADPREGSPSQRWRWLVALHESVRQEAAARGLADVQAYLPPPRGASIRAAPRGAGLAPRSLGLLHAAALRARLKETQSTRMRFGADQARRAVTAAFGIAHVDGMPV